MIGDGIKGKLEVQNPHFTISTVLTFISMQFLRVVLVALAFVLAVFGATTTPTVQIGPCIDAAGTAICRNVAKDCDSIRFRKLLREQCQATCGYC